jgi:hypothetical protein
MLWKIGLHEEVSCRVQWSVDHSPYSISEKELVWIVIEELSNILIYLMKLKIGYTRKFKTESNGVGS